MDGEERSPVALVPVEDQTSGAEVAAPPESAVGAAPTAEEIQELRNRLTEMGRERKALRDNLSLLAQQNTSLAQQVQGITSDLSKRGLEQELARIRTLPPDRQEIELLKLKVRDMESRGRTTAPQAMPQETPEQFRDRRSREILATANSHYGLDGAAAIGMNDEDLDWDDEVSFIASVKQIARRKSRDQERGVVVAKSTSNGKPSEKPKSQEISEEIRKQIRDEVLAELGVGRSNSPRPAGSQKKPGSQEELEKIGSTYDSRRGPGAKIAALRAMEVGKD